MRLWSLHPKYLDCKGLVAVWREGLLAKKVLEGKTRGYKNHPQLIRFKNLKDPIKAIESYLYYIYLEAKRRGYNFDKSKLSIKKPLSRIMPVTSGQLEYEFSHLCKKLKKRDLKFYEYLCKQKIEKLKPNPIFYSVKGSVEPWEKIKHENYLMKNF